MKHIHYFVDKLIAKQKNFVWSYIDDDKIYQELGHWPDLKNFFVFRTF